MEEIQELIDAHERRDLNTSEHDDDDNHSRSELTELSFIFFLLSPTLFTKTKYDTPRESAYACLGSYLRCSSRQLYCHISTQDEPTQLLISTLRDLPLLIDNGMDLKTAWRD